MPSSKKSPTSSSRSAASASSSPACTPGRAIGSAARSGSRGSLVGSVEASGSLDRSWRLGDILKDPTPVPTTPMPPKQTGSGQP